MVKLSYHAYTQQGYLVQGTLVAKDSNEAAAELKKQGLWVISLKPKGRRVVKRLGLQDLAFLFQQMALMLSGGLPLLRCLQVLQQETSGDRRELLKAIEGDLKNGQGLAESLQNYQDLFPLKIIQIVKAGEVSGRLDETLGRLAAQLEREREIKGKIHSALLYPGLVFLTAILAFFVIIAFIFPRLTEVLQHLNAPISPTVLGLLSWHRWFWQRGWSWLALAVGVACVGAYAYRQSSSMKIWVTRLTLRLPWVGKTYCRGVSAKLLRTLGTMLSSGVPLLEALQVVAESMGSLYWQRALGWVQLEVSRGQSLAAAMAKLGVFPTLVIQMIHAGEESGRLATVLEGLATYYEERIYTQLLGLTKVLEPVLVLGLGALVGLLVMSLLSSMVAALSTIS